MGCSQNKSRIPISIALHMIYLMVLKMFVLISGGVNAQPESHYKQTGVPKAWPISKFLLKYTSNRKVTTSKMVSQIHNQFPSFFSSIRPTGKSPQAKWCHKTMRKLCKFLQTYLQAFSPHLVPQEAQWPRLYYRIPHPT